MKLYLPPSFNLYDKKKLQLCVFVMIFGQLQACNQVDTATVEGDDRKVSDRDTENRLEDPQDQEALNDNIFTATDRQLSGIIANFSWDTDPLAGRDLPAITEPLAQLGKALFFSKSLSGNFDTACASCHHPALGGGDALSLSIGVAAIQPEVLGLGRQHAQGAPLLPRHSPTNFNAGLWDSSLFLDSRVESLGKEMGANGSLSEIRTPDTAFLLPDAQAGSNLVAAQARFPVTSDIEMKSDSFEVDSSGDEVREHLAARIGNYGEGAGELASNSWLELFQETFGSTAPATDLITFDNIAMALAEYQRSMVFVNNPWQNYVDGNVESLTEQEKRGAILFFTPVTNGGAGCVSCHSGSLLSDELHHTLASPQIGVGSGDGNQDDFGREKATGNERHRYQFRTSSLLNIAQTAPYMHTGSFNNLRRVLDHYRNPTRSVSDYFDNTEWCDLPQFSRLDNCENLYPVAEQNTRQALTKLNQDRRQGEVNFTTPNLNRDENDELIAFLNALTDPCIIDRECLAPWVADEETDNPDDQVLIAHDANGNAL